MDNGSVQLFGIFNTVSERLGIGLSQKNEDVEGRIGFANAARTHGGFSFRTIGGVMGKSHSTILVLCNKADQGYYDTHTYREAFRITKALVEFNANRDEMLKSSAETRATVEEELNAIQGNLKEVEGLCEQLSQTTLDVHNELERIISYSKRLKMILRTNV